GTPYTHRTNQRRGRSTSRMRTTDLQLSNGRASGLVDVLDRVLDKGVVVAGDVKIYLAEVELRTIRIRLTVGSIDKAQQVGIDVIAVEARVVVASSENYLKCSEAVGAPTRASSRAIDGHVSEAVIADDAALRVQIARTRRERTVPRRLRRP